MRKAGRNNDPSGTAIMFGVCRRRFQLTGLSLRNHKRYVGLRGEGQMDLWKTNTDGFAGASIECGRL
jgi:hypothetical protein